MKTFRNFISILSLTICTSQITLAKDVALAGKPAKTTNKKYRNISSVWCQKLNLPNIKSTDSLPTLKTKFDSYSKMQLTQFLWFTVLSPQPSKLAIPLLQYLSNVDTTDKTNAYYSLLAIATGIKQPLYTEIKSWPSVVQPVTVRTDLGELCDLYFSAKEGKVNE